MNLRVFSTVAAALAMVVVFSALLKSAPIVTGAGAYDLAGDFSWTQNPDGAWSYGWSASRGTQFNLVTTQGSATACGDLRGWVPYPGIISPAYAVTDWNCPGEFVPAGTVNLHPGPQGQNSVARWTAPVAGTYEIKGWFKGNNYAGPTTTDVAVLVNGTTVFSGIIITYNQPLNFYLLMPLNASTTVDFTVGWGPNGNSASDATGTAATITLVEPPATPTATPVPPTPTPEPTATPLPPTPTPQPVPAALGECKDGRWQTYGVFKNQGDCVSYVATKGKNPPAGP